MKDALGERMKGQYEDRYRFSLPRRTYTILRLDGKAFHTYTRGLQKPFDKELIVDFDAAIIAILPSIQGAVFAYTQSDEVSILLTDFATPNTDAWFDGNLQKMVSVSASMMTAEFNQLRTFRNFRCTTSADKTFPLAYFDSRAFTIPDRTEVVNYFRWRQQDCIRNSISMVAQANFSHKELHGKSSVDMHEMLHTLHVNWATDFSDGEKNGRVIMKETYMTQADKELQNRIFEYAFAEGKKPDGDKLPVQRTRWVAKGAWVFTQDEGKLLEMIPAYA